MMVDFEDWMMVKMGALALTRQELAHLPFTTMQHWIGFEMGLREKERNPGPSDPRDQLNRFVSERGPGGRVVEHEPFRRQ